MTQEHRFRDHAARLVDQWIDTGSPPDYAGIPDYLLDSVKSLARGSCKVIQANAISWANYGKPPPRSMQDACERYLKRLQKRNKK